MNKFKLAATAMIIQMALSHSFAQNIDCKKMINYNLCNITTINSNADVDGFVVGPSATTAPLATTNNTSTATGQGQVSNAYVPGTDQSTNSRVSDLVTAVKQDTLGTGVVGPSTRTVATPAEVTTAEINQYIAWLGTQPDPYGSGTYSTTYAETWAKRGIDPYSNAALIKQATFVIDRANRRDAAYINAGKSPLTRAWASTDSVVITIDDSAAPKIATPLPTPVITNTSTDGVGVVGPSSSASSTTTTSSSSASSTTSTASGGVGVAGPSTPTVVTPAEVTSSEINQYIAWLANQSNPYGATGTFAENWAKQGITDPYSNAELIKQATFVIDRANRRDATYINAGKSQLARAWQ